jgi:hypothetical protein
MRKLAFCCVVFGLAALSTAALAEQVHSSAFSIQNHAPAPITVAQVGIGTPACHTQGTLYRMANNCPPEAIAAAHPQPSAETYRNPVRQRHGWQSHRQHHPTTSAPARPD